MTADVRTESPRRARRRSWITLVLAIAILVPSLFGFGSKFVEFLFTFRSASDGSFAITPIVNYLLASFGFLLLLFWGILNGMFHDIEEPKYAMLEREEQLEGARGRRARLVR